MSKIFLFKVNNGSIRKMCEICSKLAIKKPAKCWVQQAIISPGLSIVDFKQINAGWDLVMIAANLHK